MERIFDITRPFYEGDHDVPSPLYTLINNIVCYHFRFERYYNKPDQTYYRAQIDVGPLFDTGSNFIGYRILYKGYQVQVDHILNKITVIK